MANRSTTAFKPWSQRPRFEPGAQLRAEDLNRAHREQLERQRLIQRGVFGNGVVFGYKLELDEDGKLAVADGCLKLGCGLALDCHGRELYWPGGRLGLHDLAGQMPEAPGRYTLLVHYAERCRAARDPCCCDPRTAAVEIGVVFTLRCGCREIGCGPHEMPDDTCIDLCSYICARTATRDGPPAAAEDLACACDEPPPLCATACSDWCYDPEAGVPLACLSLCEPPYRADACAPKVCFERGPVETCLVRPFVYRNPLLFDLARDNHVHLARVADLSFKHWILGRTSPDDATSRTWDEPVTWPEFVDRMSDENGFVIRFSESIRIDTLHPASIILRIVVREWRTDYWQEYRTPLSAVEPIDPVGGFTRAVRLRFEKEWFENEIDTDRSTLDQRDRGEPRSRGIVVELVIRSAMLRDRCDCMLDGRPFDVPPDKPGQAMPGTDYVVAFRVLSSRASGDYATATRAISTHGPERAGAPGEDA